MFCARISPLFLTSFRVRSRTGYFGDITRTVVKGRAPEPLRRLFDTVFKGQEIALNKIMAGIPAAKIHAAVQDYFEQQGYKTCRKNGHMHGFFHGTGHGLGLEIHEAPRIALTSPDALKPGHVVTVEPGLYYPGLGGVRLEDVACVTGGNHRNLTKFEKVFEI